VPLAVSSQEKLTAPDFIVHQGQQVGCFATQNAGRAAAVTVIAVVTVTVALALSVSLSASVTVQVNVVVAVIVAEALPRRPR